MGVRHLIKRGLQFLHGLLAFCFVLLAIVEFIRDPPYFDAVAEFDHRHDNVTKIPKDTFYNLTRTGAPSSIRHFMDMPVLMLFLAYFVVLLWRHAWGAWSSLMTICMCVILFVFILVNYIANDYFDWRFFNTRGYGILLEVFCFALGWTSVVIAVFIKMEWFPLVFTTNKPASVPGQVFLVLLNFAGVLFFLYFCLLIWFSRLYYSWACVESLDDVLLMCQFTIMVQCYACEEARTCTALDYCVRNAGIKQTFHCQSPLAALHDVKEAFCVFNYNIGFFTFVMVFAYVGGTYFFLLNIFKFSVRCVKLLVGQFYLFMDRKTRTHIERLRTVSKKARYELVNEDDEDNEREISPETQDLLSHQDKDSNTD